MIGAKTLAVLALFGGAVFAALSFGVLAADRLLSLGEGTVLFVGAFGVVVGTLMFRFWNLGEKSKHYFRWTTEERDAWDVNEAHFLGSDKRRIVLGENKEGEALDIPPRGHHAIAIALSALLALACLDARAIEHFSRVGEGIASVTSSYCPEEKEEKPVGKDPNEPGCELVRRAYALGYAKSLGTCGAKKDEPKVDATPKAVCTRRQRDEPVLHYSWRLLGDFNRSLGGALRGGAFAKAKKDFGERTAHFPALREQQRQILTSAPHASHHVFTTLPDPGDGAFDPLTCTDRYVRLAHRPTPPSGDKQGSKVFEHVVAQLLFEGVYDPPPAQCREVHVHWASPPDACAQLAAKPEDFLTKVKAWGDVKSVLDRHRLATELAGIAGPAPNAPPQRFVSFQCHAEGPSARKSIPFVLAGQPFVAEEVHAPRSPPNAAIYVDVYATVGSLFVKGFHYGHLLSEAGLEASSAAGLEKSFEGNEFLLTRLYEMESIDIYVEPSWLGGRPDLLEVYPYERHLKNFVQTFRRQYRRERGRL